MPSYCTRCDYGPLKDTATECPRCGRGVGAKVHFSDLPTIESEPPPAVTQASAAAASPPPAAAPAPAPPPAAPVRISAAEEAMAGSRELVAAPSVDPDFVRAGIAALVLIAVLVGAWVGFAALFGFDLLQVVPVRRIVIRFLLVGSAGIGIGVVIGVTISASAGGREQSAILGMLAALTALVVGVAGNVLAYDRVVGRQRAEIMAEADDEDYVITFVADEIMAGRSRSVGIRYVPPEGRDRRRGYYPEHVWTLATERFRSLPEEERQQRFAQREDQLEQVLAASLPPGPWNPGRVVYVVLSIVIAGAVAASRRLAGAEV